MEYGGVSIVLYGRVLSSGPGFLSKLKGNGFSKIQGHITREAVSVCFKKPKLGRNFTFQQDNAGEVKNKKMYDLQWPSESLDLNPIGILL